MGGLTKEETIELFQELEDWVEKWKIDGATPEELIVCLSSETAIIFYENRLDSIEETRALLIKFMSLAFTAAVNTYSGEK